MIYDSRIEEWLDKCPEHDNEILHSDDNGIVVVIRFNNEKEEDTSLKLQASSGKLDKTK
jgi:hypothetical protein